MYGTVRCAICHRMKTDLSGDFEHYWRILDENAEEIDYEAVDDKELDYIEHLARLF